MTEKPPNPIRKIVPVKDLISSNQRQSSVNRMRVPRANLNKTIDAARDSKKDNKRFRERSLTPGANNLNNTIDMSEDYNR